MTGLINYALLLLRAIPAARRVPPALLFIALAEGLPDIDMESMITEDEDEDSMADDEESTGEMGSDSGVDDDDADKTPTPIKRSQQVRYLILSESAPLI